MYPVYFYVIIYYFTLLSSREVSSLKNSTLLNFKSGAPNNKNEKKIFSQHSGREHIIEPFLNNKSVINDNNLNVTTKISGLIKPVDEKPLLEELNVDSPQLDDGKTSVPKKGVSFNATIINNNNKTKIIHKKPLVTISDSDYVDLKNEEINENNSLRIDEIDSTLFNRKNRSNFIILIIGVIFSVPIVAILFSYIYKRGADWWQHRNYKRMDFLIEGMYHN